MPLSDIIDTAITLNTKNGTTDQPKAQKTAIAKLKHDAGATREAVVIAVRKLIHDRATRHMRGIAGKGGGDGRQQSLFGLRERYALDVDARVIKDTDQLREAEFKRIIAIREEQLIADTRHLDSLKTAWAEVGPIWKKHPNKLFGEVEQIYISRRRAA
jgi:hypothetical protein